MTWPPISTSTLSTVAQAPAADTSAPRLLESHTAESKSPFLDTVTEIFDPEAAGPL
jgi:hypothetical protein